MDRTSREIRAAQVEDGAAVAGIYGPYVHDTAVSFEADSPTYSVMTEQIIATLPTHP